MCMDLLRKISMTKLPCAVSTPAAIDRLRVLEAAGHVKVLIPPAHVDCDDRLRQESATVFEITPRGWKTLAADVPEQEAPRFSGTRRRSGG